MLEQTNLGKTLVIGDIHGCGLELEGLVKGLNSTQDQLILVGDLFDRAFHPELVLNVIRRFGDRCHCLMGNHERKLLNFLRGERDNAPPHYYWAIRRLYQHGMKRDELVAFLEKLPTILVYTPDALSGSQVWNPAETENRKSLENSKEVIIAHAGINIHWPLDPNPSFTVYGDVKPPSPWWDRWFGPNLVLYGHLSERDHGARMRYSLETGQVVSIGLDTGCCHGGFLTGYTIETGEFTSVKAAENYALRMKDESRGLTGVN